MSQIGLRTAVVLYALGLFISNTYFSRYVAGSFSLLRDRYILIGATFAICLSVYMYVSSLISAYFQPKGRILLWLSRTAVFFLFPVFSAVVTLDHVPTGSRVGTFVENFIGGLLGLLSLTACSYGLRRLMRDDGVVNAQGRAFYQRVFVSPSKAFGLLWAFLGLAMYSYTAFPREEDKYGGARLKVVALHIRPERRASLAAAGLSIADDGELQPMRLLAAESDTLTLLSPAYPSSREVAYTISKDSVDVVRYEPFGR